MSYYGKDPQGEIGGMSPAQTILKHIINHHDRSFRAPYLVGEALRLTWLQGVLENWSCKKAGSHDSLNVHGLALSGRQLQLVGEGDNFSSGKGRRPSQRRH